jgi:small GTP-binding protein
MSAKEQLQRLRNLGIIAHIDAGKTTTTERILFFSGISHRIGEVDDGTAVMDWMDQERERGITITSAVTSTRWRDHTLNIVDTPGHVDFTAEVQRSLRVLDGAVVVICGVGGVEPQSEKVWHQATEYRVPRLVFINKLDRLGADFERALEDCRAKLTGTFVPLAIPLDRDHGYLRSLDLLGGRVLAWSADRDDDEPDEVPVPDDLKGMLESGRERLVEAAALGDESVLDAFLESGTFDADRVMAGLRRAVLGGDVHPVLSGTSLKNRGVRRLLDAVVDYLPSPLEVPAVEGIVPGTEDVARRNPNPQIALAALVYKVMNDESRSRLYYVRIYSGTLEKGDKVWNPDQELDERVTRIYRMHSNRKEALDRAIAGDIVALVGPKRTVTGDTFCAKDDPILLEPIAFPEPVISAAIEPRSQGDLADLETALAELAVEDPTFTVKDDPETGQKIVSGMGELHLEVLGDGVRNRHGDRPLRPRDRGQAQPRRRHAAAGAERPERGVPFHVDGGSGIGAGRDAGPDRGGGPGGDRLRTVRRLRDDRRGGHAGGRGSSAGRGHGHRRALRHRRCLPARRGGCGPHPPGTGGPRGSHGAGRVRGRGPQRPQRPTGPGDRNGKPRETGEGDGHRPAVTHVRLRHGPALPHARPGNLRPGGLALRAGRGGDGALPGVGLPGRVRAL